MKRATIVLAILAMLLAGFLPETNGQDAGGSLHIVFVLDTNDKKIGAHVLVDEKNFLGALTDSIPQNRRNVKVFKDDQFTARNVTDYLKNLQVNPKDTILFYYSGHGAFDANKGHYLNTADRNLYRSEVLALIAAKKPRLRVVLTDCCAVLVGSTTDYAARPDLKKTFNELFFQHSGIVDWNGCARGEFSYSNLARGGYFTFNLIGQCNRLAYDGKTATWRALFPLVVEATTQMKKEQTPTAMTDLKSVTFGGAAGPQGARGIRIVRLDLPFQGAFQDTNAGLLVTKVSANGPFSNAGVKVGDVVQKIDGKKMNYRDFTNFRDSPNAPKDAELTIAVKCGCGCGKLHKNCGPKCKWAPEYSRQIEACVKD